MFCLQFVVCTAVDMASGRNCVHIVHCCLLVQKPVSSVAPTSVQHQKPSPIYQTSSTKIHPVQPQTLSSTPQVMQVLAVLMDRLHGTEWHPIDRMHGTKWHPIDRMHGTE